MPSIPLSPSFLLELQNRLKTGNRRDVYLNAIPGKRKLKLDLHRLSEVKKDLPDAFIKELLSKKNLKFTISFGERMQNPEALSEEEQLRLVKLSKAFENLINESELIASERGINAFGFGYPIVARRGKGDGKITVAPLFIWSLRLQRTKQFDTWEILRDAEDPIYFNQVLRNYLQEDSDVLVKDIPEDMLEDGVIDAQELATLCADFLEQTNGSRPAVLDPQVQPVTPIGEAASYEKIPANHALSRIEFSGLFSIFKVQKQSIIDDYKTLLAQKAVSLSSDDLVEHHFQSLSSVDTDPTQQGVLHALETKRNLLIQGPPGTGKSQTLTAVLVNALENGKKVLVVCEKQTALQVLQEALIKSGLQPYCVLIQDAAKDRQTIVRTVREKLENMQAAYPTAYAKTTLERVTEKARQVINDINTTHLKLDQRLMGDKNRTWITGDFLAQEAQTGMGAEDLGLSKIPFAYTEGEHAELLELLAKGERLFTAFSQIEDAHFLNGAKMTGDNPYGIEAALKADFTSYEKALQDLKKLWEISREEYFASRKAELKAQETAVEKLTNLIEEQEQDFRLLLANARKDYFQSRRDFTFAEGESIQKHIREVKDAIQAATAFPDALNEEKLNGFWYRFAAFFSGKKKQSILHHKALSDAFNALQNRLEQAHFSQLSIPEGTLSQKQSALPTLEMALAQTARQAEPESEAAFAALRLKETLHVPATPLHHFAQQYALAPQPLQPILKEIQYRFETFLTDVETQALFNQLQTLLETQRDLKIRVEWKASFAENLPLLPLVQERINAIAAAFETVVQKEFDALRLLSAKPQGIAHLSELQEAVAALARKIHNDNWTNATIPNNNFNAFLKALESVLARKKAFFETVQDSFLIAFEWHAFHNSLSAERKRVLNAVRSSKNWGSRFTRYYLDRLLAQSASTALVKDAAAYQDLHTALEAIKPEQIKYIKQYWPNQQKEITDLFEQNSGLLVKNLYNLKSSKGKPRKSLREIVAQDINLFTTFFPVILTSPEVASLLFRGRNSYFDFVVFDEASQLRLEENIPSVLKGKQVIIAGDEHQMPPSDIFKTKSGAQQIGAADGDDANDEEWEEDEEVEETSPVPSMNDVQKEVLLSCESLLDFGTELAFHKKFLDFHYRSRHPYLIDFSNHAFYSQRLKPLPNTFDYTPIKFIAVNGTFTDGINEAEAEVVLSILEHTIHRLPEGHYPSVGVATFNAKQRDFIKEKINDRRKHERYSAFNAKMEELEKGGFFVKNLENIQGDERDVIILSTTYGKKPDGSFIQQFGPILHAKGYKLLNVIITRAKYKVYCCCSVPEDYYLNYRDYLLTEGNNKKAAFYAYLAYCKAVSEGNDEARVAVLQALSLNSTQASETAHLNLLESPFEEEVYARLVANISPERITLQQAFAGFRIDMVYRSPLPGVPPIAIECDGAKYHSSREAYLYDRHRQRILEGHGFVFHRIWSTNWWRNSKKETEQLLRFIEEKEKAPGSFSQADTTTGKVFGHEVVSPPEAIVTPNLVEEAQQRQMILALDEKVPQVIASEKVALGNLAHIRYVRSGKKFTVKLITQKEKANKMVNGVQQIYQKSPLGLALTGQIAGTIVKIGMLDNFVEILEVQTIASS